MFRYLKLWFIVISLAALWLISGWEYSLSDNDDSFTIVILPDTQYYSLRDPATYKAQANWIVGHKDSDNIRLVIHVGDLTHENTTNEWKNARAAHKILDDANIPYLTVPGNHDGKRNTARYNSYFSSGTTWYDGHMGSTIDNSYIKFEHDGLKFLVVGLEFAPRKDALCWANKIITSNPDHRVIVVTHCYQGHGGGHQCDCDDAYNIIGSGADVVWDELIKRHSNIFMVLSGHVGESEIVTRKGDAGNDVHEILTDYQFERRNEQNHGNGWFRTMKFMPARDKIEVDIHTVLKDVTCFNYKHYPPDPDDPVHVYDIEYEMSSPSSDYQYKQTSYAFDDMTVNSKSSGNQRQPAISMAADGDFVVVWEDDKDNNDTFQIYARGFEAGGCQQIFDFTVNQVASGQQHVPQVAMADNGSFVVVWEDDNNKNGKYEIFAAGFDANGNRRFDDITVNDKSSGQQRNPDVAINSDGSFVVVWEDDRNNNDVYQIYAAGFTSSGSRRFGDITVNEIAAGQQLRPSVAMSGNGYFVVAWQDDNNNNDKYEILAAAFRADGSKRLPDFTVNSISSGNQRKPDVAVTDDGFFVVAWADDNNNNDKYEILAAGFEASGSRRFDDITINAISSGNQQRPKVSIADNRTFAVTWEDDSNNNGAYEVCAAVFLGNGIRDIGNIPVNFYSSGEQDQSAAAISNNNTFVVVWRDDYDTNNYTQILGRGFKIQ